MPRRPRLRRALRIAILALSPLAGLAALVILLLLPPVRERILIEALHRTEGRLPGAVTYDAARWPAPGTLAFENLLWTDGADTLLAVRRLSVAVRLSALRRRDVHVERLVVEGLRADLPAMTSRFPKSTEAPPPADPSGTAFPREGALPGVPSLAVDDLTVIDGWLRLPDGSRLAQVEVALAVDLLAGHAPRAQVTTLTGQNLDRGWGVDETALTADLAAGRIEGASAGRAAAGWPYRLRAAGDDPDHVRLDLDLGETARATVRLDLRMDREGTRVRAVDFDAAVVTPSVEELSRVPALSERLASLPRLEGLQVDAGGRVTVLPRLATEVSVRFHENAWLKSGRADLRTEENGVAVDTLDLVLPDLRATGRGTLRGDTLHAEATALVSGARWLALIRPEATLPDSLDARLEVTLSGTTAAPAVSADLVGGARVEDFVLDRFEIGALTRELGREPVAVTLRTRALDMELCAEAEVETGETVIVRLSPLLVRDAAVAPSAPKMGAKNGRLRLDPKQGSVTVAGVEILGDAGRYRLDGQREGDRPARFTLDARWVEAPRLLTRRLSLEPVALDSLRTAFRRDAPFALAVRGSADLRVSPPRVEASGGFTLPGPRTLAALLPAGARVDDLGPLRAVFEAQTGPAETGAGSGTAAAFTVDLGTTEWLEAAVARLRMSGKDLVIDTLMIALEGITAEAIGVRADSLWDVNAVLQVDDPRFAGRFLGASVDSLALGLDARVQVGGTVREPRLTAEAEGHFSDGRLEIPAMTSQLSATPDFVDAQVNLPEGITTGAFVLDGFDAEFRSEPGAVRYLPGRLDVTARNPELSFAQTSRLDPGPGVNALVERLEFTYLEHDLRSRAPFRVRFGGADSALWIDEFELSGDMGTISGAGTMSPDRVDLRAEAEVTLPERTTDRIPAGLWPQRISLSLRAADHHDVTLEASVDGLEFGDRQEVALQLSAAAGDDGARADLSLRDEGGDLFRARGEVPLVLNLAPFSAGLRHDSVHVEARWDDFPLPLGPDGHDWNAEQPAVLSGTAMLDGVLVRPDLRADFAVTFPEWPRLADYRAEARLRLPPGAEAASDGPRAFSAGEVTAEILVNKGDLSLVRGDASVPLLVGADTLSVRVDPARPLAIRLHSEELTLADFNAFLPAQTSLDGRLQLDLEASGPVAELSLAGRLEAPEIRAATAEGSRATAAMDLTVGGTSKRPAVTGRVEIKNGVIQIPDPPKSLHPAAGEAVLWTSANPTTTPADSTAEPAKPASQTRPPVEADLDVRVIIPSALWIRGRQLNVELAGDLTLAQSGTLPTVTGELRAVRGRLVFLGRTFLVERGGVTFYGDDEMNPVLDIALAAVVEGSRINILVSGTALEPKLTLTSDPEMTEGDIMSVLLFGRTLGELDNDQMTLLETRAASVAASYAASELETRLSRQLGVDMVTIQRGDDTGREDALVIGKYLSPRALLKYEQALKSGAGFFVNLEYLLTRSLKLETLIGPQSQSGVEVNWTRDY